MIYSLRPEHVLLFMLACIAILLACHLAAMIAVLVFGLTYSFGLIALFDLNGEQNLPTLFTTLWAGSQRCLNS